MKKRMMSLLLAAVMLLAVLPQAGLRAEAATKQEPKRVIGIVFDNSSSMYQGQNVQAWCRATYAMEVFAAMMNDGDRMQVYPMNEIEVGGVTYTQENPLEINGPDEAVTLRGINSPRPGRTPIEAVTAAYEGLMKTQADEKYLIVLSDGEEFYRNNGNLGGNTKMAMEELLSEYSKDMQVMYLGIGPVAVALDEDDPTTQHYDNAYNSAETTERLAAMCNIIFGRSELPVSGDQITFDVAMSKMIVFVQGDDVSDVSVSGGSKISEHSTHYPEQGTDNPEWIYVHKVDDTLQGMIVTYGAFDAGTYSLSYSGDATSVKVYYEPDVDMFVRLLDASGKEVDPSGTLYSGTYYLEYGMQDKNGPTTSSLLGETKYELTYTINGQEYTETPTQSGKLTLELEANETLDARAKVTYLNDYAIEKDMNWNIQIQPVPLEELLLTVTGGSDAYPLTELESQAVYEIQASYGGERITGEELKKLTLDATKLTGGNAEWKVLEYTDDVIRLGIFYCGGKAIDTDCGEYELSVTAGYTDKDGQAVSSQPVVKQFTIKDNSSAVSAKFEMEEDYYVQSKLNEAEPIRLVLSLGGAPLTPEQFGQVVAEEIDVDGLACDIQPDPDNSCYTIKIRPREAELGSYKLSCRIQIPNEIGQLSAAKDSATIQIRKYPGWVILVFWILIALIIASIIWAFLNTKVLPKRIAVGKCTFNVDGSGIPGSPTCVYVGGGKKRGSLVITSPRYAANPSAACGFSLELEADSPRRTKSAARSVKVRNVTAMNPGTTFLKINTFKMIQDPMTEKLVKAVGKADAPIEFTIKNNSNCTVTAEVLDVVSGGTTAVNLTVNLKFF